MVKTSPPPPPPPPASSAAAAGCSGGGGSGVEVKYKGVRKRKWGKYVSEIRLPNSRERIWLGSYDTAEKAARAFDAALFCLRGPQARFNFPDDPPPEIPAGGQAALTPGDIQAVAQQYANSHHGGRGGGGGGSSNDAAAAPQAAEAGELEETSPSSNSIDWSFLDVLGNDGDNAGYAMSDFGLFPEPDDMYMPPHFATKNHADEEEDDGDDHGNERYFLWNF